jgi:hypothetical protein
MEGCRLVAFEDEQQTTKITAKDKLTANARSYLHYASLQIKSRSEYSQPCNCQRQRNKKYATDACASAARGEKGAAVGLSGAAYIGSKAAIHPLHFPVAFEINLTAKLS